MKAAFFGAMFLIFAPTLLQAQDTLSKADFVKVLFKASLVYENPDTLSGDLYRVTIDSTTVMWSESFGFGKVWLKGYSFTFRHNEVGWGLLVNDEVQQKLEMLDETYIVQIIKKIKNKRPYRN